MKTRLRDHNLPQCIIRQCGVVRIPNIRFKSVVRRVISRKSRAGPSSSRRTRPAGFQGRTVRAPVAIGRVLSSVGSDRVPTTRANGRNMIVTHRERFDYASGLSTGLFEAYPYALNPGDSDSFPWLEAVANRYEKYKFRKLNFHFVPQCSTATNGTVTLAFDFDPNDIAPLDMTTACTYHDYVTGPAWSSLTLKPDLVNGDRLPQKLTRNHNETQVELNNYDLGKLYVCTAGFASSAVLGYLEVEYEIEFFIHQLPLSVGGGLAAPSVTHPSAVTNYPLFSTNGPIALSIGEALPGNMDNTTGTFTFTQPWQGLINVYMKALYGLATDLTVTTTIGSTLKESAKAVNATTSLYDMRVNAARGDTIMPIATTSGADTLTSFLNFANAPFSFMDL